jgi:3-methyl-2-oxobutanoate hydroxymethyltransferase
MSEEHATSRKTTILDIQSKKDKRTPITMLTAYDYPAALLVDQAGIDIILVGDSLGMVVLGLDSTVPVTMEEMLHHCRAVCRGANRALLVGDMPFMSYQAEIPAALRNAARFMKEAGMDTVKVEGGREVAATVRAVVDAGIPVMGHIGLTPQSASKLGGFRVQGKTAADAVRLLEDALFLQDAGCYAIVLEAVPERVAELISKRLEIPTIGIGAGAACDGQVLVFHDLVGLYDRFTPRFVRQYADIGNAISEAVRSFAEEVESREFPTSDHIFTISDREYEELLKQLEDR